VFEKVFSGRGGYHLRYASAGKHVEANLERQVVVLANHGRAERIYHMSSGKPSTPTVRGSFRFYSKTPGTNGHGMLDSNYFIGGYAIHGYPEVPTSAASHGCIRVPNADAASIYGWIALGDRIWVY
jgi:lipoprotein-anchoring transpeptidase ErfK/SrfK